MRRYNQVDFLREAESDPETGETIDNNPSFYESTVSLESIKNVAAGAHTCPLFALT